MTTTYYKATQPDGMSFHGRPKVSYTRKDGSPRTSVIRPHPTDLPSKLCGPGMLHVSDVPYGTLSGCSWPCRLFGDVGIRPTDKPILTGHTLVPREGVQVVRGEATGNTHWLDSDTGALWAFAPEADPSVSTLIGELIVPEGGTAYLTHTDEHGSNAIGAGTYRLSGKRTQAAVIERVYD